MQKPVLPKPVLLHLVDMYPCSLVTDRHSVNKTTSSIIFTLSLLNKLHSQCAITALRATCNKQIDELQEVHDIDNAVVGEVCSWISEGK